MTSRCHHRLLTVPYFSVRLSRTSAIGGHLDLVLSCPMEGNPGQSWTLGSLSVELGFRISIFNGIPDSLSYIPDSKAQDSGPHRQNFFRILDSTSKISWILESDSLIWCESLSWRWLSHLLSGPGTVWEESLNPDARLLGKVETNYKMAASDGKRSTPTILRKNRGTWTVYSHHDAVVKVTTKRKTHKGRQVVHQIVLRWYDHCYQC